MKTHLDIVELATLIRDQNATKRDFVAPAPAIVMLPDASISVASADLFAKLLTKHAHKQLGEIAGIPADYYERMRTADPALLSRNVNRWMSTLMDSKNEVPRRHMVRTLDDKVRAILSDRYQRIDNFEVFEVVMSILAGVPRLRVVSASVTETRMYIKAVTEEGKLTVPNSKRVGDIVEKGVCISNSEVGAGSLSVSPFAHYLACLNGAIRNDGRLRAAHLGRKIDAGIEGMLSDGTKKLEDAVVLAKVKDVLNAAFDQANFERYIAQMGEITQQRIEGDAVAAVEMLGPTIGLQVGERQSVLRHLIEGGDLSRYGLMNAVTRTAEDVDSYDRATEVEAAGTRLADLAQHDWLRISKAKPVDLKKAA
jgi:hypothetical protein